VEATSSGCTPGCRFSEDKQLESFDFIDRGPIEWFSFAGEYFTSMLIPPPTKGETIAYGERDRRQEHFEGRHCWCGHFPWRPARREDSRVPNLHGTG